MAIGDPVFHQLGDLVGGVCFVGVQPVAGGGGHDIEPGQVQTGNPAVAAGGLGALTRSGSAGASGRLMRESTLSVWASSVKDPRPNPPLRLQLDHLCKGAEGEG